MTQIQNPFLIKPTNKKFIALKGQTNGYLQIAPAEFTDNFNNLNPQIFLIAQTWAQELEQLGAKKVYWITLSEIVTHLHIHVFPRWSDQEVKGLDLFALREECLWPWNENTNKALNAWADKNQIAVF